MATLEEVKKLIAQRDDVDKQIAEQEQVLKDVSNSFLLLDFNGPIHKIQELRKKGGGGGA